MLLGARALQGAFGALLAPSALSLLTVTFTASKERAKAFGIYGAIAGGGAAIGLIARRPAHRVPQLALGALRQRADRGDRAGRRAGVRPRPGHHAVARPPRLPGVALVTAGLIALVYGFTRAETEGWRERGVAGLLVAAGVLLVAFVVVESRTRTPLLPLRVILDRNRGGAYLSVGLSVIGMFGLFLFLTYYLQTVKRYSPVETGLAFLPMTARHDHRLDADLRAADEPRARAAAHGAGLCSWPRPASCCSPGCRSTARTPRWSCPRRCCWASGMGTAFMPAMNLATAGVDPHDAGVASAMVNTSQQVGGSLGTALLNTIGATATTTYVAAHAQGPPSPALAAQGLVHGFTVALWWAVGVVGLAALAVAVLINSRGERRAARVVAEPALAEAVVLAEAPQVREFASVGAPAEPPGDDRAYGREYAPVSSAGGGFGDPGTPVRGRVRGGDGVPVSGAALTLIDLGGRQVDRAITRADGAYALTAPVAGPYMLITAADGHQPQAASIAVGDRPLGYDVTLSGTAGLAGVVRSAATGARVMGAMVVVTDAHGEVIASAETGPDGEFSFDDLVSGTFVVAVSAGGHRPGALPVDVAGQSTTRCEVELPAGARVHGTVRAGTDNLLLADARVTLVDAAGNVVATATTGADGEYAFEDLDPGPYTVIASGYPPVAAARDDRRRRRRGVRPDPQPSGGELTCRRRQGTTAACAPRSVPRTAGPWPTRSSRSRT